MGSIEIQARNVKAASSSWDPAQCFSSRGSDKQHLAPLQILQYSNCQHKAAIMSWLTVSDM